MCASVHAASCDPDQGSNVSTEVVDDVAKQLGDLRYDFQHDAGLRIEPSVEAAQPGGALPWSSHPPIFGVPKPLALLDCPTNPTQDSCCFLFS